MCQLEILNLNKNPLQDISPLKDTSLRELSLSLTSVKDLTPLRELPLERLSLSDCKQITSLEPLKDLVTLKALKVPARRKDYQFLKELKHLDELSDNWRTMKPHKFWEKYSLIIKD